jgi:prepilin-type N-terminal cleavage/methylation domain-containing protein
MSPRKPFLMPSRRCSRGGFTLTEVMVAAFVSAIIAAGIFSALSILTLQTRAGMSQLGFIQEARRAQQRLVREVQQSKYFEIRDEGRLLLLYSVDNTLTQIRYVDEDDNPRTVADNRIEVIRPDGERRVICRHVSLLQGDVPVFRTQGAGARAVMMAFHVGDSTAAHAAERRYETGPGYQGVEVRVAATPRNLQRWYD